MKRRTWLLGVLSFFLWTTPAAADNRFIVRSALGSQGLSSFCLLQGCTVVGNLDGTLNQLFLLTTPDAINPATFLSVLQSTPGIVDAELDQLISLVGGLNILTTPPPGLLDTASVNYFGSPVWNGYANQPAAMKVRVSEAQGTFGVAGTGIVADIDTGVDPNHPALQPVLLPGYDFTRNQTGGSEMADFTGPAPQPTTTNVARVNQSTAAVLDQSTAAVLDQNSQYAAFGHGTMVLGVIHLVAPKAQLMPLKAFRSDGTAFLSDILRAMYYAVQNKANVINMSFSTKTNSVELSKALDYANQNSVISAASAGNDGVQEIVYPAALQNDVMGAASTDDLEQRSSFSNFGDAIVWVAAPGEAIITAYPFSTYAAGWGTSFSAPFVSGTGALLLSQQPSTNESQAAAAVAHAVPLNPTLGMGHGRLDIVQAMQSLPPGTGTNPDFAISANPASATINAGQSASYAISATPSGGFNQTVTWTCSGTPADSTCTVSPSSAKLDGTNPATATVTVATTARSHLPPWAPPRSVPLPHPWTVAIVCLALLLTSAFVSKFNRASGRRFCFSAALLLLVAALCTSCGGGASQTSLNPPPPPPAGGTPSGTSTVIVTGTSGNVSHATSVKLTVN